MKKLLSLLMMTVFLAGCGQVGADSAPTSATELSAAPEETQLYLVPEGSEDMIESDGRIFYEVFVGAYADSNGDGLGDLKGLQEKLPYIEDLGARGLWLMPIHPSPSYHKYDVTDYQAVDPGYGSLKDLDALIADCHSRDMQVILDLVLNHSSDQHPWFLEACRYLSDLPEGSQPDASACESFSYYHFQREPASGYHAVPGAEGWYYEGRFTHEMPDLNFDSPELLEKLREIMEFWLSRGVDGFRLDAAKEYETGKTDRNIEILRWVTQTARELKPDVILVGEVWDSFHEIGRYYESGLPSIFNYPFGSADGKIVKVLRNAGNPNMVGSYAQALQKADTYYRSQNPDYVDAPFLSNHDVGRIAGFLSRDLQKTKLAGAMNLFMSGRAFLYYGEEIGMVAGAINDPSYRAPMVWQEGAQAVQPPPGCTLPESYPFGSLETQQQDSQSIYGYYRAAAAIRNATPELANGIPQPEETLNQGCISAVRKSWQGKDCILLMNIDDQPASVDLTAYGDWSLWAALAAGEEPVKLEDHTLALPPYGLAIFRR